MTLLESVLAFVLLAVVGVACIDLSRGATGLETRSVEWGRAVAVGEAALSAASVGVDATAVGVFDGARGSVERRPWAKGDGVDVVTVTVTLPDGATYRTSRLVPGVRSAGAIGVPR
jgi:hypothetical protein